MVIRFEKIVEIPYLHCHKNNGKKISIEKRIDKVILYKKAESMLKVGFVMTRSRTRNSTGAYLRAQAFVKQYTILVIIICDFKICQGVLI
jgi:hypothetical protein